MNKRLQLTTLCILALALLSLTVYADTLTTDRLNYFNSTDTTLNRSLHYLYEGTGTANVSIRLSPPFNFTLEDECGVEQAAGINCTCTSVTATAECNNVSAAGVFFAISPTYFTEAEYSLSAVSGNSTSGDGSTAVATNTTFIKIRDDEIFHTLVEFGRGRGNYFYDSLGRTSSASQGTGYPYVPNATRFELSYLHKIFNIRQYYGLATTSAENATWSCVYPNNTVVRMHLATSVDRAGTFDISYAISEIEGSFERQGFISQDFDASESVSVGNNFTINCTAMTYTLDAVGGNITVDEDAFTLTYRDSNPFNLSATTTTSTLANGTQIMDITYSLTNLEVYPVDDVRLELDAPDFCTFVNTKGELFGVSQDKYLFERTRMSASSSEQVTLTARCTLADSAAGLTALNLSGAASIVEFIPSWEVNAYNPAQSSQTLVTTSSVAVDQTQNATIVNILDTIEVINSTVADNKEFLTHINNTVLVINQTVEENNVILEGLNLSFAVLNNTVNIINGTVTSINITLTEVLNLTLVINNTVGDNEEMLILINGTVQSINGTVSEIHNLTLVINNSLHVINTTLTEVQDQIVIINNTVVVLNDTANDIEGGITIINNTILIINGTVNEIRDMAENITNVTELDRLDVSATLFTPEDVILVDALFTNKNGASISGASCNISLMDSALTELVSNQTMTELTIAGVTHYTYNVSNVSILGGANTGKFFGHVECKNGNKRSVLQEADFEVREAASASVDLSSVLNKLARMEEFDQEMVFLVTDSFGLREEARQDAMSGRTADAMEKLSKANQQLTQVADRLSNSQTLTPTGTATGTSMFSGVSDLGMGLESYLWASILILAALLIYMFKHHHVHEPDF